MTYHHFSDVNLWYRNWSGLQLNDKLKHSIFNNFIDRYYSENHRHYHTIKHVLDCLDKFDTHFSDEATCPEEIRMAIWFHDLVYDTRIGADNEQRSADIAQLILQAGGANELSIRRICAMIESTTHDPQHVEVDKLSYDNKILLDVDLSIFAEDECKFNSYEKAIRKEFDWVSDTAFAGARVSILKSFMEKEFIFHTDFARKNWETIARNNISKVINGLSQ